MEVHDIELTDYRAQPDREITRIVKPSEPTRPTIVNKNPIKIDRTIVRHIAILRAIYAGGEDMDPVASLGKTSTQRVNGMNRTAITDGRKICRNDVKYLHSLWEIT